MKITSIILTILFFSCSTTKPPPPVYTTSASVTVQNNTATWITKNEMFVTNYFVQQYINKNWVNIATIPPKNLQDSNVYKFILPKYNYYYRIMAATPKKSYYTNYKFNRM